MTSVKHTPVTNSSNVASYGYDAEHNALEVKFRSGSTYRYPKVSQAEYDGLTKAQSVGAYVHANFAKRGRAFQKQQADGSWA